MGNNYVEASPETLRLVASYFDEPIRIVKTTNSEYLRMTTGLGPVWGDDHIGREWAKLYVPANANIIDTHEAIEDGLVTIQGDLLKMAENYEKTDTYNQA